VRAPVAARIQEHHLVSVSQVLAVDAGDAARLSRDARPHVRDCRPDERQLPDVDAELFISGAHVADLNASRYHPAAHVRSTCGTADL
jgi:hypothetical protein